jgi:hypothetical protein
MLGEINSCEAFELSTCWRNSTGTPDFGQVRAALRRSGPLGCYKGSMRRGMEVAEPASTFSERNIDMATYDATTAQCLVYSYKEGILSRIAHDLKHRVTRFTLRVDPKTRSIAAEIDARSLRVECVMKEGVETVNGLSEEDRKKIEEQVQADVLRADAHPLIKFQSTAVVETPEGLHIDGTLALNDRKRPVSTLARRILGQYVAELTINQPAFGIKPFSAMMGTLKIKPDVVVRLIVPAA